MSELRELSTITKRELKNAFPQCKFSLSVNYYGGSLDVLRAPKSWYTNEILTNPKRYCDVIANIFWIDRNEILTAKGKQALEKMYKILRKNLGKISGSYYDETSMDSVSYQPNIRMYGTYSHPLELVEDNSLKGHYVKHSMKSHNKFVCPEKMF